MNATLFDTIREKREKRENLRDVTIQAVFERYHRDNPRVFALFRQYAGEVRDAGLDRFSADAIIQRIRWHMIVEVPLAKRDGGFKINDHFSSRYGRMLVEVDPSFEGFFEFRKIQRD